MNESQPDSLVAWAGSGARKASELAEEIARNWTNDANAPVLQLPFAAYKDLVRTLDTAGTAESVDEMFKHVVLARFLLRQILVRAGDSASGNSRK